MGEKPPKRWDLVDDAGGSEVVTAGKPDVDMISSARLVIHYRRSSPTPTGILHCTSVPLHVMQDR